MQTPISALARTARATVLSLGALVITGCGVASISPIVRAEEMLFDPALSGDWVDTEGGEAARITGDAAAGYHVVFIDSDGDTARFDARLGRLGAHRVLDIEPDLTGVPHMSAYSGSLVLTLHSFVVIDRVTETGLEFRMIEPDSLSAILRRDPARIAHSWTGESGPVITAETGETRRFFDELARRPGVLSEPARYRRRSAR